MSKTNLSDLTAQELEDLLKTKREQERKEHELKRKDYEDKRDKMVARLVSTAQALQQDMKMFKSLTILELEDFRKLANDYGDIRSNSKGGFTLRNADGSMKVMYERNVISEYDERADWAEDLLRNFLGDMVKKRDSAAYEVITGLLQRGSKGDFNPAAIAALLKMEDKFDDERWIKAIKLFKESYNSRLVAMNVSFFVKNSLDKDEAIKLTFASIPVDDNVTNVEQNKL